MKRLGVFVIVCSMVLLSQQSVLGQDVKRSQIPFFSESPQLEKYLVLNGTQVSEIYNINGYFIDQKKAYLTMDYNPLLKNKNFEQIVYANLKLLKNVQNGEQYRKYLSVLNVAFNNKLRTGYDVPDIFFPLND